MCLCERFPLIWYQIFLSSICWKELTSIYWKEIVRSSLMFSVFTLVRSGLKQAGVFLCFLNFLLSFFALRVTRIFLKWPQTIYQLKSLKSSFQHVTLTITRYDTTRELSFQVQCQTTQMSTALNEVYSAATTVHISKRWLRDSWSSAMIPEKRKSAEAPLKNMWLLGLTNTSLA